MLSPPTLLLVLDLAGTFAFALDGAVTALRTVRLDIVGVIALAVITALGGGLTRDLMIGAVPPATFSDWRYLAGPPPAVSSPSPSPAGWSGCPCRSACSTPPG